VSPFGPTAPTANSNTSVPAVLVPNEPIGREVPGIRAAARNVAVMSRGPALFIARMVLTAEPVPDRETTGPPLNLSKLRPAMRVGWP
jgi:hypothetical protein